MTEVWVWFQGKLTPFVSGFSWIPCCQWLPSGEHQFTGSVPRSGISPPSGFLGSGLCLKVSCLLIQRQHWWLPLYKNLLPLSASLAFSKISVAFPCGFPSSRFLEVITSLFILFLLQFALCAFQYVQNINTEPWASNPFIGWSLSELYWGFLYNTFLRHC